MLAFVGVKMLVADLVDIPILVSLGVVAALFGGAIVLSLRFPRPAGEAALPRSPDGGF